MTGKLEVAIWRWDTKQGKAELGCPHTSHCQQAFLVENTGSVCNLGTFTYKSAQFYFIYRMYYSFAFLLPAVFRVEVKQREILRLSDYMSTCYPCSNIQLDEPLI